MAAGNSQAICIIGMHRSGTSMIAQLLRHRGLYLGADDQLLGPSSANADGHFEHLEILRINDELLRRLGGSWDYPPVLNFGWERDPALSELASQAKTVAASLSSNNIPWGWKEPRTGVLLPFWKSIVGNLRFVICVRNPIDVAKSLANRDGMTLERGASLWERYMRDVVRDTVGSPRIFVSYEEFFTDATTVVDRLVQFCGLSACLNSKPTQTMISAEKRHHSSYSDELFVKTGVSSRCKILYMLLDAMSLQNPVTGSAPTLIGDIFERFLQITDAELNQNRDVYLEQALVEKDMLLRDAKLRCDAMQVRLHQLEQEHGQLQRHAEKLEKFSNAVRATFAYRIYAKLVRPLKRDRDVVN